MDKLEDEQSDMKDKCILNKTAALLEPQLLSGKLKFLYVTCESQRIMEKMHTEPYSFYNDDDIMEHEMVM